MEYHISGSMLQSFLSDALTVRIGQVTHGQCRSAWMRLGSPPFAMVVNRPARACASRKCSNLPSRLGLVLGGLAAVLLGARSPMAQAAGQIGAISGSALGLLVAIRVLVTGQVEGMSGAWPMPGGGLHLEIDALSAFFLLPVFGLSVVTGLYGRSYLAGRDPGSASTWFHLNLLTAA